MSFDTTWAGLDLSADADAALAQYKTPSLNISSGPERVAELYPFILALLTDRTVPSP